MEEVIHIYHINDLHSHFEHWPRIQSFLQERKRWHSEAGDDFFIFDIGEYILQICYIWITALQIYVYI